MPHLALGYGRAAFDFSYDAGRWQVLAPPAKNEAELSDAEIGMALDAPIGSPSLEEIISADESALIVVSDATRATVLGSEPRCARHR